MIMVMRFWNAQRLAVMSVGLYAAVGAGELTLQSTDAQVQPLLHYHYLQDVFDRQRLREGVRLSLRLGQHAAFHDIIDRLRQPTEADLVSDATLDDWLRRHVITMHHISGTCKMGPAADTMAVVDQYGHVHGLSGLRVVDASILPDCPRANTNVVTMMLGERMADFMRRGDHSR
jgi:choline dehydrogenase-like flavoprotein